MKPRCAGRGLCGRLLIVALTLNAFFGLTPALSPARAQDRAIVVNADQPNVWTLEQAHYLLAQMHRRNLDLRTKNLEELDPNEIAGLRFDVLRTLVELGVAFDDANRVSNRILSRNRNFNAARREELIARRQRLRDESLGLTREIGGLQAAKAAAATQEERDRLDAEITAKAAVRTEVDKEVQFTDQELGTLTAPSGDFQRTEPEVEFNPEKLPESIFDDAFKDAAKTMIERFNQPPRLNASLRLENFLQMQYEIIAKQLTLLRDEVGPGERLLFLELPQTVNVTHHEADKKWAQDAFVSGVPVPKPGGFVSSSLIRAEIPTPPDETIQATLSTGNRTLTSKAVPNPAHLKVTNVTIISYEPATRRSPVAVLVVKLEGSGFSEWLKSSVGDLTPVSSTEALLRIENPAPVTRVVLADENTGFRTRAVVTLNRRPR